MKGHRPRKRFGQHFLHDRAILRRIVESLNPRSGELIVEIGPGRGALTRELLAAGVAMHVVEIDRDLARALRAEFPPGSGLTVHEGDALEFDFRGLRGPGDPLLRIIGNLPYNVSTPLLLKLMNIADDIRDMCFMMQREVVDRLVARPGSKQFGRLTVMTQWRCDTRRLFNVGPGAFVPPPKVESSLVELRPVRQRAPVDPAVMEMLVREAFSSRRKTLRNALKRVMNETAILAAGVDPHTRPEDVSVDQYIELANTAARAGAS